MTAVACLACSWTGLDSELMAESCPMCDSRVRQITAKLVCGTCEHILADGDEPFVFTVCHDCQTRYSPYQAQRLKREYENKI